MAAEGAAETTVAATTMAAEGAGATTTAAATTMAAAGAGTTAAAREPRVRLTGGGALSVVKVERSASGVEITYSNGVREEIENGRFEQKDAAGRTVIERPATGSDVARLDGNARRSRIVVPTGSGAPRVEASAGAIEVSYPTGWREELEGGRYELKDPNNNTVVEREATSADVRRLRALAAR